MNTDRIEDALKYDYHAIDMSTTPKLGMTGCMFSFSFLLHPTISHFFVEFLDILATEDGFRVSLSRAVEIEPLIMRWAPRRSRVCLLPEIRGLSRNVLSGIHILSLMVRRRFEPLVMGTWGAGQQGSQGNDKHRVLSPRYRPATCQLFFQSLKLCNLPDCFLLIIDFCFILCSQQ